MTELSTQSTAEPALRDLIEQLRQMERRREAATPGSSEYIELVGFEHTLADEIRARILGLDTGPNWGALPSIERGR